jgi:multidrug resistance efflux pump
MRHISKSYLIIAALLGLMTLGGTLAPAHAAELTFTGKLTCYIKRPVIIPMAADIIGLNVQPGTKVKEGEILGRYRLIPESLAALHRRLISPQILDMQAKMADINKGLELLQNKRNTLQELARQNMAPAQSLAQVDQEIKALSKQRSVLQEGMSQAERTKAEEEALVRKQLGVTFKSGHIPKEGVLVAPIDGYVVWMHPDLRQGAQLGGGTPVMILGVMDPMLLRAPVHEIEALKLKVGDEADITVESIPGQKFTAQVSRLPWAPPTISLDQPTYYDVEFKVPNPDLLLKEGLKATIEIRRPGSKAPAGTTREKEAISPQAVQGK